MDLLEIIGPVMVGPSSSHTAGAVRLGLLARTAAGFAPVRARIDLHGSFAETGKGHGTDRALVVGLLGWRPENAPLRDAARLAAEANLHVTFHTADLGMVHPNTVRLHLEGSDGQRAEIQGSSVGGGAVVVTQFNGWSVELAGQYETLLLAYQDRPGMISRITGEVAASGLNIATMRVARRARGGQALTTLELDEPPTSDLLQKLSSIPDLFWARHIGRL